MRVAVHTRRTRYYRDAVDADWRMLRPLRMALRYTVTIDNPSSHTVTIELRFAPRSPTVDIALPAWCPGSYMIRDYARFVRDLTVTGDHGERRAAEKVDKQTWRIDASGARELVVRYGLYGHELTVRTNHIDSEHAFLHGPATFLYPVDQRGEPVEVALAYPPAWELTCAASRSGDELRAESIDELFDHPIHVGTSRTYQVPAKLPVTLAIWGERAPGGTFDESRLVADVAAIVDDHVARFGEAPFASYAFILMLTHDGFGGLEHRASSVNLHNPHFAVSRKSYESLLELLSHELFHAWNGKRIAPQPLLEFDYAREAYTRCLWVMEGITSYYDRFAVRTSGRMTTKSYLDKVLDDWARLQATPGRARHSLEQSSFDAWIKLYKPDESNLNTTVSYYLKGGLVMFALDLQIRRRTENAKSLDDVIRLLWARHGVPRVPYPENVQPLFEEATGLALGEIFDHVIRGTADPDLAAELAHVGLVLKSSADPATVAEGAESVWLGITVSGTKVTGVFDDSPAHRAGLSPGDEVVALDRFRTASDGELRGLVAARRAGDTVHIAAFRRHRLVELGVPLAAAPPTRWEIAGVADAGAAATRYEAWLGEPHPGAQTLATVTTTSRWI